MSVCKRVKKWITQKVQVPVEKAIKKAREKCTEVKKKIEEKVKKPIEEWISKREKRCKKRKCKKWCLCCNKWFCWFVNVLVKVVTWVFVTVIKWVTYLVCKIVMVIVAIVVVLVVRILKFLVSFVVCIFTDPLEALKSLWELWKDLLDVVKMIFDFIKGLLMDLSEVLNDIKGLTCALSESFGWPGRVIFGLIGGLLGYGRGLVGVVCDLFNGFSALILGLLNLETCSLSGGLTNVGVGILNALLKVLGILGAFTGGITEQVRRWQLKKIIAQALEDAFGDDPDRIDRIEERIAFYSCPMGLPVGLDARRLCIRSTATTTVRDPAGASSDGGENFLKKLHDAGQIDLFALAGQIKDCGGKWSTNTSRGLGEVVYTGTDIRVSKFDLKRFLDEGPDAIPEFTVYPITKDRFEHYLGVSAEKALQLGLRFSWGEIRDYPTSNEDFVPLKSSVHPEVFTDFPRIGTDDPLCSVPTLTVFAHWDDENGQPISDENLYGLTSWYRPPAVPKKSGVSFVDRVPEAAFQTVLAHEHGHYFGLDHEGHDGLQYIMFSPKKSNKTVTGKTFVEYLLLTGTAIFTKDDGRVVWRWLTEVAAETCLPN